MNPHDRTYPFRSVFSLKPLIEFWGEPARAHGADFKALFENLCDRMNSAPELLKTIQDVSILSAHEGLLQDLMSAVFPSAFWESAAMAAVVPFTLEPVWVSPEFRRILLDDSGRRWRKESLLTGDFKKSQIAQAFYVILKEYYGIDAGDNPPLIYCVDDPDTGLLKYFRLKSNFRFTRLHVKDPSLKTLSEDRKAAILDNIGEPEKLRKILPPDQFEFQGFVVMDAEDVTESEVIARLSMDLINKDSVMHQADFFHIEERLKILFQNRNMETGLAAIQGDQVLLLNHGQDAAHNCTFADSRHVHASEFDGSVFEPGKLDAQIRLFRDLRKYPSTSWVDNEILEEGFSSLIVAPLYHQNQLIGILKLTSPEPDTFGTKEVLLTQKIRPLFSMAIRGVLEKINQEVESVIKVKCTAIHPSVEWRFRKAAFDHLGRVELGETSEMEPVVFRDVFPLRAASDIRGSSEARNRAIQADLKAHLRLALEVVRQAGEVKPIPLLKRMMIRINSLIKAVDRGIGTGEDVTFIRVIQEEIEPEFPLFAQFDPRIARAVNQYNESIDPKCGTVYQARKAFEESVSLLNARLSEFLGGQEMHAQSVFPHYFSKHQTDGLDYVIYVGESILQNGQFSMRHVSNLRLWQLTVACGMAWWTENIRPALGVPLETTHLILATHTPLSIRFRYDEKRFDVDQVYDIAHEIIWSRIDKAMVKGGAERLTQTGKLAVVYSRPQEAEEMRYHIEYLQGKGFFYDDMEWLELENLQGLQGLKALRVGINVKSTELAQHMQTVNRDRNSFSDTHPAHHTYPHNPNKAGFSQG